MHPEDETCWTLIQAAAAGETREQEAFARTYDGVVRTYFMARWRRRPDLMQELDDAVQEVFVDCFRPSGALTRADPERGGFRGFLYGVVRNVALRAERRAGRNRLRQETSTQPMAATPADDESLGAAFDRSWARMAVRVAGARMQRRAALGGDAAQERVRLLHLRFRESLPIRDIARRWDTDPARLHHVYATARKEFRRCLRSVVAYHHPGADDDALDTECERLLELIP